MIRVETLPDAAALAARAADYVAEHAGAGVAERGTFSLAVSGGATPAPMFRELATRRVPWEAIHLFQVDERVVPPGHPDRNLGILQESLLDRIPIPEGNVHLMGVNDDDLDAAARAYAQELRRVCGEGSRLDLVHLGLGSDGHTASWPPGDPVVEVTEMDVAVVGPFRGRLRMTLTPPPVNRAREILWLVAGPDKADALRRLLAGDPGLPATRVRTDHATLLAGAGAGVP
ncbi:MAG: 6-phosphogluconolactonase [Actinomycetota bacterium]